MREDNSERFPGWMGAAAAIPLLLCCAMPILLATFGLAAVTATVKYGIAGMLVVGLLGVGLYLLRAARRRRQCGSAPADAMSHCGCDPTVPVPLLEDPAAKSTRKAP